MENVSFRKDAAVQQRIRTNLWFNGQADEAAAFYCSIFESSRIVSTVPYTDAGPGEPGSTMVVEFELDGQSFIAINGGPQFTFSEAISLEIICEDQAEVDRYWDALLADGGTESVCGWLKDKYGLSWQVVPKGMDELFAGDPERAKRAMDAMFQMKKLDIETLRRAADGVPA